MAHTAASKKQKGTRLEVDISQRLRDTGIDPYAQRMILSGGVKGFDGDVKTSCLLFFEAKNQETWKPLEYYKQCVLANPSPARKLPVVVMSKNRLPEPLAMLSLDDLLEIYAWAQKAGIEK